MDDTEEYKQYREHLITMLHSINAEIPLEEPNMVLIMHLLNSIEKIRKFFKWIEENLVDGELKATEAEIARAAVHASKEEE